MREKRKGRGTKLYIKENIPKKMSYLQWKIIIETESPVGCFFYTKKDNYDNLQSNESKMCIVSVEKI